MNDETQNNQQQRQGGPAEAIANGARLLGLAALGALVTVGEESNRLFNTLVQKGEKYQPEGREKLKSVGAKVGRAMGEVENAMRDLGDKVRDLADRGEECLDERVAARLHRVGVPTREDLQSLINKVDELAAKVEELRSRVRPGGWPA